MVLRPDIQPHSRNLAIVEGVKAYRPYLIDKPFTVITDHKPLLHSDKFHPDSGRLGRWALYLQDFKFNTVYKSGKTNLNADTLSRVPYEVNGNTLDSQNNLTSPDINELCAMDVCDLEATDISELQRLCPEIGPIYAYHNSDILPDDKRLAATFSRTEDQYVMDDGILFHLYFPGNRRKAELLTKQLVVPKSQRHMILSRYHDDPTSGGHQGIDRTYASLLLRYYWPRMYTVVTKFVKTCDVCQRVKHQTHRPVPLTPMPVASIFGRWHMDFLCTKQTSEGYKYLLLVVDSFTCWCEVIPTKSQDAETVARILYTDIFSWYGAPKTIVSDLGRQFTSKLVKALCELFNVKQNFTSPYHPQTNATCERLNSFIIQSVKAYGNRDQSDWPEKIPAILMAYRSTPATRSTEFSPYQLVFGRTMTTPIDNEVLPKKTLPPSVQQHLSHTIDNLAVFHAVARENVERNQQRYKNIHDRRAKDHQLEVGDRVLLSDSAVPLGLVPKLHVPFKGPYTIVQEGLHDTFHLRDAKGKVLPHPINANRLRQFHERPEPETEEVELDPDEAGSDSVPGPAAGPSHLPDPIPPLPSGSGAPPDTTSPNNVGDGAQQDVLPFPMDEDTTDSGEPPKSTVAEQGSTFTQGQRIRDQDINETGDDPRLVSGSRDPPCNIKSSDVQEVLQAVTQNKKRFYKVRLKGHKPGDTHPWIFEDVIPPSVLAVFRRTKTQKGRVRRRKTPTFFIRK